MLMRWDIVLVRRVVEARRIAAQGGAGPNRTAVLPPLDEKDVSSLNAPPDKNNGAPKKERFWKRLKCW